MMGFVCKISYLVVALETVKAPSDCIISEDSPAPVIRGRRAASDRH